ncbi:MAG TPA: 3'-5' exonuclease, partial [Vicinamibacteria bacterium]|nr:3'-5' exonuclease [Vicinamibacteria bacterium]
PFQGTEDILRAEAATLAPTLQRLASGGCEVRDMATGALRPSRAGDVMILVRRLTQIRFLEEALEEAGLRFTVEGGKSFFDRLEVREALAILRAIDDPMDRISLVAALRSSFLGVSDRDIATYALAGGPLWHGKVDETKPSSGALGPALELLASLHGRRTRCSVPFLLESLYDETRILPALAGSRKGEAQIANLEKIVTLARQASDLGILTLRGFVRFLQERIESAREEPDLPASRPGDPHTLRILSIHKAKGLEAPIVALFDSADTFWPSVDCVPFWKEGRVALGFRKGCQQRGWDVLVAKEKVKEEAESRRLLYVATTRARDLLILPHSVGSPSGGFWSPLTEAPLTDVDLLDAEEWIAAPRPDSAFELKPLAMATGGDPVAERWDSERAHMIEEARQRPFVPLAAVRAAARTAPPPVFATPRPGARDFGTLVHRTLELIDLDRPEDAPALALSLAPSLGLDEAAAESAATLTQRTLALPLLDRARKASRCFRELPLVFPDGGDLVEGVVDLVFEEAGGFTIVDYKTDSITEAQALDQAAHHAPQLQLYGRGLA